MLLLWYNFFLGLFCISLFCVVLVAMLFHLPYLFALIVTKGL